MGSALCHPCPNSERVRQGCTCRHGATRLTDHLVLVIALEDLPRLVLLLLVEHAILARVEPEEVTARLVQVFDVFRRLEERRVSDDADRGGTVDDEVDRVATTCEGVSIQVDDVSDRDRFFFRGQSFLSREREGGRDPLPLDLSSELN